MNAPGADTATGVREAGSTGTDRRQCTKLIRFTPDELRAVNERAVACGRPVAVYVREAALGAAARARPGAGTDALVRALARLGNRLTHLARIARERDLPDADVFERDLAALLDVIRDTT